MLRGARGREFEFPAPTKFFSYLAKSSRIPGGALGGVFARQYSPAHPSRAGILDVGGPRANSADPALDCLGNELRSLEQIGKGLGPRSRSNA